MKKLILLLLLFSFDVFAATGIASGGGTAVIANTITVGGRVINLSDPNVKTINGLITASGRFNSATYFASETPIWYQVPAGKTAEILALRVDSTGTVGTESIIGLVYGDNPVETAAAAPTNAVYCGATSPTGTNLTVGQDRIGSEGQSVADIFCRMRIPAGKYPAVHASVVNGGVAYTIWVREE